MDMTKYLYNSQGHFFLYCNGTNGYGGKNPGTFCNQTWQAYTSVYPGEDNLINPLYKVKV